MAISSLFAKFKGLGPVIVVGGAVLVTIKLLTTQTPQIEEIIQVKAEEDIKTDDYQDQIEPPKEPEPPAAEEKEPVPEEEVTEDTAEDTEQDEEEEEGEEEENGQTEQEKQEQDSKQQPPPEPPKTQLKFRDNDMGRLFGKLFKSSSGKG